MPSPFSCNRIGEGISGYNVVKHNLTTVIALGYTSAGTGTGTFYSEPFSLPQNRIVPIFYGNTITFNNAVVIAFQFQLEPSGEWLELSTLITAVTISATTGFTTGSGTDSLDTSIYPAYRYRLRLTNANALDASNFYIYFECENAISPIRL